MEAILTLNPADGFPNSTVPELANIQRSIDVIKLEISWPAITMTQMIYSLDGSGNRLSVGQTAPYTIFSRATNDTLVDPSNGLYVIQNGVDGNNNPIWIYDGGTQNGNVFSGNPMGEYSFLIAMMGTPVNIKSMMTNYILLNASLGEYDV